MVIKYQSLAEFLSIMLIIHTEGTQELNVDLYGFEVVLKYNILYCPPGCQSWWRFLTWLRRCPG